MHASAKAPCSASTLFPFRVASPNKTEVDQKRLNCPRCQTPTSVLGDSASPRIKPCCRSCVLLEAGPFPPSRHRRMRRSLCERSLGGWCLLCSLRDAASRHFGAFSGTGQQTTSALGGGGVKCAALRTLFHFSYFFVMVFVTG